jgi:hypothetical protein
LAGERIEFSIIDTACLFGKLKIEPHRDEVDQPPGG